MGKLGYQEIVLIGLVILVMFGGRKIPEFMRGLGKGIREFNDAKNNAKKEIEKDDDQAFFNWPPQFLHVPPESLVILFEHF